MKSLVVYYYKEDYDSITNLAFFLKHGLLHNPLYHYAFIVRNNVYSLPIKESSTIKIYNYKESDYDLASYKWFFKMTLEQNPFYFNQFKTFYFISSNCIGPFLPTITSSNWIDLFNKKLETCDLIAPIVEFPPDYYGYSNHGIDTTLNVPFLHSYMFGTNSSSLDVLKKVLLGVNDSKTSINYERRLTSEYLLQGKKIQSLLMAFNKININDSSIWNYTLWNKSTLTCYEVPENYFGIDINPLEIVFVKNIRKASNRNSNVSGISSYLHKILLNYINWY
jgi:hypothetical protein